jgi:hypothetical protein
MWEFGSKLAETTMLQVRKLHLRIGWEETRPCQAIDTDLMPLGCAEGRP